MSAGRLALPTKSRSKQIAAREEWNSNRCQDSADFFTCGYSGRGFDDLLDALKSADVRCLVDVRQNPVSMYRPELSKKNLAAALKKHRIEYMHIPELGVPRDVRGEAIDAGTRDPIWEWYDRWVAARFSLHTFLNFAEHPIALMCTEADPTECHRHRLSLALEDKGLRGYDL